MGRGGSMIGGCPFLERRLRFTKGIQLSITSDLELGGEIQSVDFPV